jgi:hypothetical protein
LGRLSPERQQLEQQEITLLLGHTALQPAALAAQYHTLPLPVVPAYLYRHRLLEVLARQEM